MIDLKNYNLLNYFGFENKTDAYEYIRVFYAHIEAVTTYYDNEDCKYYIVQSKALMSKKES